MTCSLMLEYSKPWSADTENLIKYWQDTLALEGLHFLNQNRCMTSTLTCVMMHITSQALNYRGLIGWIFRNFRREPETMMVLWRTYALRSSDHSFQLCPAHTIKLLAELGAISQGKSPQCNASTTEKG